MDSIAFDGSGTDVGGVEELLRPGNEARLQEWMQRNVGDTQHVAGSCRMGRTDDDTSVVDPRLRVKQVAGLRVADASVMPAVVRANTHLTCVMIGEMAAELIRADQLGK